MTDPDNKDPWKSSIINRIHRIEVIGLLLFSIYSLNEVFNLKSINDVMHLTGVAIAKEPFLTEQDQPIDQFQALEEKMLKNFEAKLSEIVSVELERTMHLQNYQKIQQNTISKNAVSISKVGLNYSKLQDTGHLQLKKNIPERSLLDIEEDINHPNQKKRSFVQYLPKLHRMLKSNNTEQNGTATKAEGEVEAFCNESDAFLFQVDIQLDDNPNQTSWELIEQQSGVVVANQSYENGLNTSDFTFQECFVQGKYKFTIFDSEDDGIDCENTANCYNVSVDNEIIDSNGMGMNEPFRKKSVQSFDSSSPYCLVGSMFLLEAQSDFDMSRWTLMETIVKENVHLELFPIEKNQNFTQAYFACLFPGIYDLSTTHEDNNKLSCQGESCYRVSVDNVVLSFENENLPVLPIAHSFYVSNRGLVRERHCQKLPLISPINKINEFIYDERVARIMNVIQSFSNLEHFLDLYSHRYMAACFILFDDALEVLPQDDLIERYILSLFLYSTNQKPELLLPEETCDYDKVSCNDAGRIIEIDWFKEGFEGTIPSELSYLQDLEKLNLGSNRFHGTIPSELGRLFNLKRVALQNNEVSGTIPTEVGLLSKVEYINIRTNNLVGTLPSELGLCQQMNYFSVSTNKMTGTIPSELFLCVHLEKLNFPGNDFTGTIPSSISQLQQLNALQLFNTKISGHVPPEIGEIKTLQYAWLFSNRLTGTFPKEIGNLTSLDTIWLNNNSLQGTLPDIFENFDNVKDIRLADNNLSGSLPDSLWNISFDWLYLQNNEFTGTIPMETCALVDDMRVDDSSWFLDEPKVNCDCCGTPLHCNVWDIERSTVGGATRAKCPEINVYEFQFFRSYEIHDFITNTTSDEFLGFETFTMRKCVSPTGCYKITTKADSASPLKDTYFGYSNFQQGLRNDECDAVNICGTWIDVDDPKRVALNHITQKGISDLSFLGDPSTAAYKALCWIITEDELIHEYNECDGTLIQRFVLAYFFYSQSSDFGEQFSKVPTSRTCDWPGISCDVTKTFVENISLPNQKLEGTLITEIGLLQRLKVINLNGTSMRGNIDSSIFQELPHLSEFIISHNNFEGEIPVELFNLPMLQRVDLSDNSLVGTLPDTIYPKKLERMRVADNFLQGPLPKYLFMCKDMHTLDLSQNSFTGIIPETIGVMQKLDSLGLYKNQISGSIPVGIFNAKNMRRFSLHSNKLTGSIPTEIGNFENVQNIKMDHNLIKGKIPSQLSELKNIRYLHLQDNQLTGLAPKMALRFPTDTGYITDCGKPSFLLPTKVECDSCTICCNSEKKCQKVRGWTLGLMSVAVFVFFCFPLLISIPFVIFFQAKKRGYFTDYTEKREALSIVKEDSVYSFIFSNNKYARTIYLFTAVFQSMLFVVFLQISDIKNEASAWQYTIRCPDNSIFCENESTVGHFGWFMFIVVITLYLGADLSAGFWQVRKGVALSDWELYVSGFILTGLTSLAVFTSAFFNLALAESNADIIVNAVILLFINDLDEQFMSVLLTTYPTWAEQRQNEVQEELKGKSVVELARGFSSRNVMNSRKKVTFDDHVFVARELANSDEVSMTEETSITEKVPHPNEHLSMDEVFMTEEISISEKVPDPNEHLSMESASLYKGNFRS